ncbi:hypothetical protein Lal_00042878 [Lupinus albus]|nr:hypothetical protein Lal_00042878 [Lupinus albus]
MDCPNIQKSSFKGKNELKNGRRAYIAWEDNDTSSASEPESEEQAHLSLMASRHSDDKKVNESIPFSSSELQTAFNDLHDEYMKLSKMFLKQKYELDSLRNIPSSSSCLNCITLGNKVSTLSLELNKINKSSKSLSKIINDQRHSTDRRSLGYEKGPALKKQTLTFSPGRERLALARISRLFQVSHWNALALARISRSGENRAISLSLKRPLLRLGEVPSNLKR